MSDAKALEEAASRMAMVDSRVLSPFILLESLAAFSRLINVTLHRNDPLGRVKNLRQLAF